MKNKKAKQTFANLPKFGCLYEGLLHIRTSYGRFSKTDTKEPTMKNKISIFFYLVCFNVVAQQNSITPNEEKRTFKNQGEQENYWAENFFKKEYKEEHHIKFTGQIVVQNSSSILFDNKTLQIWGTNRELFKIFENGIFYPQLLIGYEPAKKEIIPENVATNNLLNNLLQPSDTLKVSSFEELKFLESSPKVKRFRCWVYWPGSANPQVYLLELKNDKADDKTNFDFFIKEARLTFLKGAWIIL